MKLNNILYSSIITILFISVSSIFSACSLTESEEEAVESYPEKSIDAIVPWSAGGGSDIAFRGYMKYVSNELGEDINIKNVTGGNSAVGLAEAVNADPDGYNMSLVTFDILTNEAIGTSSTSYKDFEIINIFSVQGMGLITHSDYGYESIEDFLEKAREAKENGERLTIGTNDDFGVWHQAGVLMAEETDTEGAFRFVPFTGSGDQTTELLGKHLDAIITSPTAVISQIEEGSLQPLASMTEERPSSLEDVPTFKESGYNVIYESFRALAMPKDVPKPIIDKVTKASEEAFHDEEFQEWANQTNIEQEYMDSNDSNEFIVDMYPKVKEVVSLFQ